jgi:hypothetical protein
MQFVVTFAPVSPVVMMAPVGQLFVGIGIGIANTIFIQPRTTVNWDALSHR